MMQPPINRSRLEKVLALTSSPNEGEALAALRLAHSLLAAHGLTLADVLTIPVRRTAVAVSVSLLKAYETRIDNLEAENARLRGEIVNASRIVERWKMVAEGSTRDSQKHQVAAEKWRTLAHTTANNLWELGQQLQSLDDPTPTPHDAAGSNVVRFTAGKG